MHDVAPSSLLQARSARVPFRHPVRVTIAGERVVRVLSGDVSPHGLFLQMDEPPESGTVVVLAFEAGGRVLPFAEGEVAWRRCSEQGGFGVRFTRFLHPRAEALLTFLAENLEDGALRPRPVAKRRRWAKWVPAAAVIPLLVSMTALAPSMPPVFDPSLVCQPQPVVVAPAPVAHTPVAPPSLASPVRKPRKRLNVKLPQGPRVEPTLTRGTASPPVQPAHFSSTPMPSGAARLVNVSRVSGGLRVAVDTVATGHVRKVQLVAGPPRVLIDISGSAPTAGHEVALADPEVKRLAVARYGKGTRLTVELARAPQRVVQQGESALLQY